MGICAPGVSQPKAISPAIAFLVGEATVALAVETLGLSVAWASLLAYAAGQTISTVPLCAGDPPAMPVFNPGDIAAILTSSAILNPTAFLKLHDLINIAAWYTFCECSTIATPAPPAAPAYPPAAPVVNPPQVPTPTAGPCWDFKTSIIHPTGAAGNLDWSTTFFPGAVETTGMTGNGPMTSALPVPTGANALHLVLTISDPGATVDADFSIGFFDSTKALIAGTGVTISYALGSYNAPVAIPATAVYWQVWTSHLTTDPPLFVTAEVSFYCSGVSPTSPLSSCCPPDPALLGQLAQILNVVNSIYSALPPSTSSYGESVVHAGLTGGGVVLLGAGCIAVKVTITGDTSGLPTAPSNPTFLFDRGFIVPIAVEGPIRGQVRLVYSPQLYQLPPLADSIGYQLATGVTISITELTRGP
jgi:hypothetical protein